MHHFNSVSETQRAFGRGTAIALREGMEHTAQEILPKFDVCLRVTQRCNLRCKYCSAGECGQLDMSPQTLTDSLHYLGTRPGGVHTRVLWFGGEPSLVPITLYEHGLRVCDEMHHKWAHAVQTNGQRVSMEMLRFWQRHGFGVGVSCDGPGTLTDMYRGPGAYANIVRTLDMCAEIELKVGLLAVLHRGNVDHIDEIVDFARARKCTLKLSPMKRVGRGRSPALDTVALPEGAYATAMRRVIDRWVASGHPSDFAASHQWIAPLVRGKASLCMHQPDCQTGFGAIDADGSVYPCARVYDQPSRRMGHVTDGWDACRASPARDQFRRPRPTKCGACRFGSVCSGGCPLSDTEGCGDTATIWAHAADVLTGADHAEEDDTVGPEEHPADQPDDTSRGGGAARAPQTER